MNVLITGGAGYIGSHTAVELLSRRHKIVIVDNLINSSEESIRRVEKITNNAIPFYNTDLRNEKKLDEIFSTNTFDAVIHFAGLKSVGESVSRPLEYYENNIGSTISLLKIMEKHNVKNLVFSSSATVYGTPESLPLKETSRTGVGITNPYGQTKYMIEQILKDISHSKPNLKITLLRYFNPVGAHESGMIGEDPQGVPNNLLPYIAQVAVGRLEQVNVFGDDYNTPDGTGVRDYIHVVDLAQGHVAALENQAEGVRTYNLGTGLGVSVMELIKAYEDVSHTPIPYSIVVRRPGDIASCYADCSLARQELHWEAKRTIRDACLDSWKWQKNNPKGYDA